MSHPTRPLRRALTTTLAAALGLTALTALPAAADVITRGMTELPYQVIYPQNSPLTVDMWSEETESTTFPAGTYWIAHNAGNPSPRFWESDQQDVTFSVVPVTLDAPGPISHQIPDLGPAGRIHVVSVNGVAADAPDPTGWTSDQYWEYLRDHTSTTPGSGTSWNLSAVVTSGAVQAGIRLDDVERVPVDIEPEEMLFADFLGIGVDTMAYRIGNAITVAGPDGANTKFAFGRPGDVWFAGDWDGDGKDTIGLRRGNQVFLDNSLDGGDASIAFAFGRPGDEVFVGDWDGDGKDSIGLRRGNLIFLDNSLDGGDAEIAYAYGRVGDEPFAGDWDGDGRDTVSLIRGDLVFVKNSHTGGDADEVHVIPLGD